MNYAPHTLQKRVIAGEVNDEYGRPITGESAEEWSEVCKCRCDDNGDKEVKLSDGTVVIPSYHIVLDDMTLAPDTSVFPQAPYIIACHYVRGVAIKDNMI